MATSIHTDTKMETPTAMRIGSVMEPMGNQRTTTIRALVIDPRCMATIRIRATTQRRDTFQHRATTRHRDITRHGGTTPHH